MVNLDSSRYEHEVPVAPEYDQRIDIIDRPNSCAYEFKVSGKNAHNELYKDIVKILLWNERRPNARLRRLVFITDEENGRRHIDTPMVKAYLVLLAKSGLQVDIEYIRVG